MMECRRNEFRISIALSRYDKNLSVRECSFDRFCSYFTEPFRTSETMDDYMRMDKTQKDECKDVGGYVCGYAIENNSPRRKIMYRSMVTLDLDYAKDDTLQVFKKLFPYQCLIHSTRNCSENNPRYRIIIPLMKDVGIEQYEAVARMIAKEYNILDVLDVSTFQACRLMYFPSVSCDSDYVYEVTGEGFLNPDDMLCKYDDWKDASSWPGMCKDVSYMLSTGIRSQKNPLEKSGPIGEFNRRFSIEEAIKAFLQDVYQPSSVVGRYDYIRGTTKAGLVIYEGIFAYSFHATDPASYRLCSSFDLVRIHLFGYLDKSEHIPDKDKPSFKQMMQFAKKKLGKSDEAEWMDRLQRYENKRLRNLRENFDVIFRNDPELNVVAFEESSRSLVKSRESSIWGTAGPWQEGVDMTRLMLYLERAYLTSPGAENYVRDELELISQERSFNQHKDWMRQLVWDGEKRVDTLLVDYLGAEDTRYTRAVTRKTLVAAIARVFEPGVKYDEMMILSGPQGCGKSTLLAKLGGERYTDSLSFFDLKDKTAAEKLQGKWIVEIPELVGLKESNVREIRSFLSRTIDDFRPAYGRQVERHPRTCILIGTTNDSNFLIDETGNRRFYPVFVSGNGEKKSWNISTETVEQIWAEAYTYYKNGEMLVLDDIDLCRTAQAMRREAIVNDDRAGLIEEYLNIYLPENWDKMDAEKRLQFLDQREKNDSGNKKRQYVCCMEIWVECFRKNRNDLKAQDSKEIRLILEGLGWTRYTGTQSGKRRTGDYGLQCTYVSPTEDAT